MGKWYEENSETKLSINPPCNSIKLERAFFHQLLFSSEPDNS